jgi:hypothetical protein
MLNVLDPLLLGLQDEVVHRLISTGVGSTPRQREGW